MVMETKHTTRTPLEFLRPPLTKASVAAMTQKLFDNASEGILLTDEHVRIISVNKSFELITLYSQQEVIGKNPSILRSDRHEWDFYAQMWTDLNVNGHWKGEIWNKRKDGQLYIQRQNIYAIKNRRGVLTHYVSIFDDITKFKLQEEQIVHMSFHDALTGLPNRQLLIDRIERNIERCKRDQGRFALLFINLNRFKQINDSFGHDAGDTLLIMIAIRLRGGCRIVDTLCRFGGDEFIILIDRIQGDEGLLTIIQRLFERIEDPIPLHNDSVQISAFIGIALYPGDGENAKELISHADTAMHHAKSTGKNRYAFFDAATNEALRRQLKLEMQLHHAFEHRVFELYFQPKISLVDGCFEGAEVLLRWMHEGRFIPPSEFIPLAEENGSIVAIGAWVLQESFRILRDHPRLRLAINVSAKQIHQDDMARHLEELLSLYAVNPECIEIELTESAFINNPVAAGAILKRIRAQEISIALDDFGTGFSSLGYLKNLPIDVIKIDQSFVRDLLEDREDAVLVESIIALARALGKRTIAEGAESEAHVLRLRHMGCDSVQGYHIARPMPLEAFLAWVEAYPNHRLC